MPQEPLSLIARLLGRFLFGDVTHEEANAGRSGTRDRSQPALEPPGTSGNLQAVVDQLWAASLKRAADGSDHAPTDFVAKRFAHRAPEQLTRGRHKQRLVRRPDRQIDTLGVKLEDEIVERGKQSSQASSTVAERLTCLCRHSGSDRDDLAQ